MGTPTRPDVCKISVCDTSPTNTAAGTEISGTGYTAGGQSVTFAAASGGSTTGHSGALTWTNGSGADWDIDGFQLHHAAAGAPANADIMYWADAPALIVPNGIVLEIAAGGITVTET